MQILSYSENTRLHVAYTSPRKSDKSEDWYFIAIETYRVLFYPIASLSPAAFSLCYPFQGFIFGAITEFKSIRR